MSRDQGFVVIADLRVKPEDVGHFLEMAERHAKNSLTHEPGCLQFDVTEDAEEPGRVLLYEVYTDQGAFEHHARQPYLAAFREATADMVLDRRLHKLTRRSHPAKPPAAAGKVLVAIPYLAERQHLLRPLLDAGFEVVVNTTGRAFGEPELIEHLPGIVATIAGSEPYNERVLARAPDLRCIARLGVGYDRIDVPAATRHGVAVAMAFGTNHEPVADHAFALMAALANRIVEYDQRVRAGGWGGLFHGTLHGATVGIVGFGRIGRAFAKRCQGFGMDVLVADPAMDAEIVGRLGCELVDLETLLSRADFVSVHAFLSKDTEKLIDARRLALMKPTAYLINTARGPIVDEAALVRALQEGRIAGAGLDVFEVEPLPADSPLKTFRNVVLSPHVAGLSDWAVESMTRRCVESILTLSRGEDPGSGLLLNPEALARRAVA